MGVKNRLGEIRLRLGYKRANDFADFLGIEQSQYSRYENNKMQPKLETLIKIMTKLEIWDMREIFHFDNTK